LAAKIENEEEVEVERLSLKINHLYYSPHRFRSMRSTHPTSFGRIHIQQKTIIQPKPAYETYGLNLDQAVIFSQWGAGIGLGLFELESNITPKWETDHFFWGVGGQMTLIHSKKGPGLAIRAGLRTQEEASQKIWQSQSYEIAGSIKFGKYWEPFFTVSRTFHERFISKQTWQEDQYALGFLSTLSLLTWGLEIQFSEHSLNLMTSFKLL
jgi:hypothetical protein